MQQPGSRNQGPRLDRQWLARPAEVVARQLIGCVLMRTLDDGRVLTGVINETEAYTGPEDRASHAYGGRRTPRNESMWGPPGMSYVYFTYGMHFCFNVACLRADHPAAILIRAIEPVQGIEAMRENRSRTPRKKRLTDHDLCSGPAKLCQALEIDRSLDGVDLLQSSQLTILKGEHIPDNEIEITSRVGIASAQEWAHKPLRWARIRDPG